MRIKDLEGDTLFESPHNTIKETVEAAVQQVVSLAKAILTRANLDRAYGPNQLELQFFRRNPCA